MSIHSLAANVASIAHKKTATGTIYLIGPDGVEQEITDAIVLSGRLTVSPDSGEEVVVFRPVVTIPRSSLSPIPADDENWAFRIPLDPLAPTVLTTVTLDKSKANEGGRSLNTIRFYLSEVQQS